MRPEFLRQSHVERALTGRLRTTQCGRMALTLRRSNAHRARITSQGQITVPKSIRDRLGLAPGDEIEFEPAGDTFMLRARRRRSVLEFAGIAGVASDRLPGTAEELDRVIGAGMAVAAATRQARVGRARRPPR
jgi:antitoxin PrlF